MSGPYCRKCRWFRQAPLTSLVEGYCYDPAKRIHDRSGNHWNEEPFVPGSATCRNWQVRKPLKEGGDDE